MRIIKQIKSFFTLRSLASRRIEEYTQICGGNYKTKADLLNGISVAIGPDWKSISEIEVRPNLVKTIRYLRK